MFGENPLPKESLLMTAVMAEWLRKIKRNRLGYRTKRRAERIKWYEAATVLQIEIIQVVKDGCLARVLNDNQKRIFLELTGPDFAQGQRYEVRAERSGTFKYATVLGAPSTVER